ncbi:hypothetical protein JCM11251_002942 [Rhodosporidiobolus azoricus]
MKCRVVEIRWHDRTPIYSTDFHATVPHAHKKPHHPYAAGAGLGGLDDGEEAQRERDAREKEREEREKMWRLATCGHDNQVRLWLVHPRPAPSAAPSLSTNTTSSTTPAGPADPGPRVEYLATLSQHTGVVNCVRFAPCGEMLASAGDDGNILIWIPGEGTKKIGESDEDKMYEKESWRVKSMIRSMSGKEIYDLAWSPDGEKILAGSVDHTATIYDVASGMALAKIADHNNYVQGVAWDPLEKYIATQSSDRSMHVYSYAPSPTGIATHAIGKNARMEVQRKPSSRSSSLTRATSSISSSSKKSDSASKPSSDTPAASTSKAAADEVIESFVVPSSTRPPMHQRSLSRASDTSDRSEASSTAPSSVFSVPPSAPPKPDEVTTPMDPPTGIPHHPKTHSRRSSTSGSVPSASPSLHPHSAHPSSSRPLRSPSPAPLPAVMVALSPRLNPTTSGSLPSFNEQVRTDTIRLYGDAESTRFFRRLAWSPDGGLLLTPAGLFEDPYAAVHAQAGGSGSKKEDSGEKEKGKGKDKTGASGLGANEPKPTVYIYSRANLGRPPIAHLPGHSKVSIAIRFCPILWELRELDGQEEDAAGGAEERAVEVKLSTEGADVRLGKRKEKAKEGEGNGHADVEGEEKKADKPKPRSLFDLPYRMVYAVATYDCVYLYDTQQAGPIAIFSGLHFKPFSDLTWSADGQTLMISSEDGYCSVVAFEPGELGTPYPHQIPHAPRSRSHHLHDPHAAHNHPPHSHAASSSAASAAKPGEPSPSLGAGALPALFAKAADGTSGTSPVQPAALPAPSSATATGEKRDGDGEDAEDAPPAKKQKKRAALTLVGPLGS